MLIQERNVAGGSDARLTPAAFQDSKTHSSSMSFSKPQKQIEQQRGKYQSKQGKILAAEVDRKSRKQLNAPMAARIQNSKFKGPTLYTVQSQLSMLSSHKNQYQSTNASNEAGRKQNADSNMLQTLPAYSSGMDASAINHYNQVKKFQQTQKRVSPQYSGDRRSSSVLYQPGQSAELHYSNGNQLDLHSISEHQARIESAISGQLSQKYTLNLHVQKNDDPRMADLDRLFAGQIAWQEGMSSAMGLQSQSSFGYDGQNWYAGAQLMAGGGRPASPSNMRLPGISDVKNVTFTPYQSSGRLQVNLQSHQSKARKVQESLLRGKYARTKSQLAPSPQKRKTIFDNKSKSFAQVSPNSYRVKTVTHLGGGKAPPIDVDRMRKEIQQQLKATTKITINRMDEDPTVEADDDAVSYEREYDFSKPATEEKKKPSAAEMLAESLKHKVALAKGNLVLDKIAKTVQDNRPFSVVDILNSIEGPTAETALDLVTVAVGGRPIVLRDYTSQKYDDFVALRRNEKYYINKSDYVVPPEAKTKGNEKVLPAVKELVRRRDMFKNKFQQMSQMDVHIQKTVSSKTFKQKTLRRVKREATKALSLQGKEDSEDAINEADSSSEDDLKFGDEQAAETPQSTKKDEKDATLSGRSNAAYRGDITIFTNPQKVQSQDNAVDDNDNNQSKESEETKDQVVAKQSQAIDVFRQKVRLLQQRSLLEIKKIDGELGRLKTQDETITIPKVQQINSKIDYSILLADEENEEADDNQTKLEKVDEGPGLPVTNTQMKESSQDQKEPKDQKEEKGPQKPWRRTRTIQKNVVDTDEQKHEGNDEDLIPAVKRQKLLDQRAKVQQSNEAKLSKMHNKMVRDWWEHQLVRPDDSDGEREYVEDAFEPANRRRRLARTLVTEKIEQKKFNIAEGVFMHNSVTKNRDRFSLIEEMHEEPEVDGYPSQEGDVEEMKEAEYLRVNAADMELTGAKAALHQTEIYRNIDNLAEGYLHQGKKIQSPLMNFLSMVSKKENKVYPRSLGYLHRKHADEINLNSFYMQADYIQPFVKSLQLSEQLAKLDLQRTSLTSDMVFQLVAHIPVGLRHLNISHNQLGGHESIKYLCNKILDDVQYKLTELLVEGCQIGDEGAVCIAESLTYKAKLQSLDISDNNISANGAEAVGSMLKYNKVLRILLMGHNPIASNKMGGVHMANGLKENEVLQVLDLSFCGLGRPKADQSLQNETRPWEHSAKKEPQKEKATNLTPEEQLKQELSEALARKAVQDEIDAFDRLPPRKKYLQLDYAPAQAWSEAFNANKSLLHLDMSHNGFDSLELEKISEGLDENHTILGIHFAGNEGDIDALGFIKRHDDKGLVDVQDIAKHTVFRRIEPNLNQGTVRDTNRIAMNAVSNCWICEGWSEVQFDFSPKEPVDELTEPVKLHLCCDGYEGGLLQLDAEKTEAANEKATKGHKDGPPKQVFATARMLPPGQIKYYYSVKNEWQVNPSQPIVDARDMPEPDLKLMELGVSKANYIENVRQTREPITEKYLDSMRCVPRAPPVILEGRESLKTPWDFYKSVFKTYKPDNQKLLDDCFEIDWPYTKCEKIVRNDLPEVKAYLKEKWVHIREAFKYYAGLSPLGRVMGMGSTVLAEMLHHCSDFVDQGVIKNSDVDLQFIACNGGKKVRTYLSPDKGLVRFQMIEVLVRLAIDKYIKTGVTKSYLEAVTSAFENHYLTYFSKFDCHQFRKHKLWREEIDVLYTRLEPGLKIVFQRYSGKYIDPGTTTRTMSLEELIEAMTTADLVDDHFGQREIGPCFNLAMMTQKDELATERQFQMHYVEFLEALARCADKFDLRYLEDNFPAFRPKHPYKLDKKLESVCLRLMRANLPEKHFDRHFADYKSHVDVEVHAVKAVKFKQR